MFIQDLHKPAHMGAFEAMGKVHVHIHAGDRVLNPFGLIQDRDRVADILYPNFIDLNSPVISLILDVVHCHLPE
jgi:hypothetical protein